MIIYITLTEQRQNCEKQESCPCNQSIISTICNFCIEGGICRFFSTVHVKLKQKAYPQNGKCYIWYHTLTFCACKHHKLNSWKIDWTYVIFPWVWNMFCFEPNFMNFIVQALFFVWVPFSNFCTFLYLPHSAKARFIYLLTCSTTALLHFLKHHWSPPTLPTTFESHFLVSSHQHCGHCKLSGNNDQQCGSNSNRIHSLKELLYHVAQLMMDQESFAATVFC